MRQDLAHAFARSACHLQDVHPDLPPVFEKDLAKLLIHASPEVGVLGFREHHAIWIFDRYKDDQIDPFHCAPHTRQPVFEVEPPGLAMRDQVGEEVHRAAVENCVRLAAGDAVDRSLELELEVFEGRHLLEVVPLFYEKVVGLINHFIGRKSTRQNLDESRLS